MTSFPWDYFSYCKCILLDNYYKTSYELVKLGWMHRWSMFQSLSHLFGSLPHFQFFWTSCKNKVSVKYVNGFASSRNFLYLPLFTCVFFISGQCIQKTYFPILVPVGITGNCLSFLVRAYCLFPIIIHHVNVKTNIKLVLFSFKNEEFSRILSPFSAKK